MITLETLREKAPEIRAIAEKYGAENIRVFGSVARGDQSEDSDVDLLVDGFNYKTGFERVNMQEELSEFLHTKVDIAIEKHLHWYIKPRIISEMRAL